MKTLFTNQAWHCYFQSHKINQLRSSILMFTFLASLLFLSATSTARTLQSQTPKDSIRKLSSRLLVTHCKNVTTGDSVHLYLNNYIMLTVDSLKGYLNKKPNQNKIILFIDGVPFKDINPVFSTDSTLTFYIHKNSIDSNTTIASLNWDYLYRQNSELSKIPKIISIGFSPDQAIPSDARMAFIVIRKNWYWAGIFIILSLVVVFVGLSLTTSLLKDNSTLTVKDRPYSLSRTQFAFWLLVIGCSYILLWISSDELPLLTNSVLILLGISGGTSIVSKVIDNNHTLQNNTSENFLVDILSDENGISVHRLQMLTFTLIVGFIFVHHVIVLKSMPEFDNNLLLLMGISSGTYAGFKASEK